MKNFKLPLLIAPLFLLGLVAPASAHNPRLVYDINPRLDKPIEISSPDVSQAFYGKLSGTDEYYHFQLPEKQDFYFKILVPNIPTASKDFSVDLKSPAGELLAKLDGGQSDWIAYHEKFANDNYFAGPEKTINLEKGDYLLKVYNQNNSGKYSLVVGTKEAWPPKEIFNTIITLPALKIFFEESPFTAYFNYVGLAMGVFIVFITGLVFLIRYVYRQVRRRK